MEQGTEFDTIKFTSGKCKVPPLGSEEQKAQLYNFQIWKMDPEELHADCKFNMSQGCNVTLRKPKASLGCTVGNRAQKREVREVMILFSALLDHADVSCCLLTTLQDER